MGMKATDAHLKVIELLGLPITLEEYRNQVHHLWRERFPHCNMMPGESNY